MTDHYPRTTDRLFPIGVLTAIFLPIVGAIIGIVMMAKDDTRGAWILIGSIVWIILIVALSRNAAL